MNRILVIDDNPDNLTTVKALLNLFLTDCNVITALSGEEGLQTAMHEQPDTILLDIQMPQMDGFEVCRRLKADDSTAHIPIIILTAIRTDSNSRVKALNLGADAFLTKPIDESELAAQVRAMLRIKRAEDRLRNKNEHLEELVAQRVNDLRIAHDQLVLEMEEREKAEEQRKTLERQLLQAQKLEAIGALAGGIAHDFNNILSPIIGYAEILKADFREDKDLTDAIAEIYQAAIRAKSLVKQILTFSCQMDHEITPIKIQPILKEVINLSHSIIPSTISIKSSIDRTCRPILADPVQIHQMLMNLITNAYHAMIETGGTLSIHLTTVKPDRSILKNKKMPPGEYISLKIEDTGIGIEKDILSNIFDPYFTTKGIEKGTGLGLSVVHGIVKNTRGEIFVHSVPGQGTCFEIYLPVIEDKFYESIIKQPDIPKGNERILLVDDERHVIKIVTRMLEHLGYQVTASNDSKMALDLFYSHPDQFDVLVTDLTMPGLNGGQLSKKILEDHPDFPIIMCTGFSETLDEKSAKTLGIKAFLMKPVILSDLAHTIRVILDKKSV